MAVISLQMAMFELLFGRCLCIWVMLLMSSGTLFFYTLICANNGCIFFAECQFTLSAAATWSLAFRWAFSRKPPAPYSSVKGKKSEDSPLYTAAL